MIERDCKGWVKSVKMLYFNSGFGDVWNNQGVGDIALFTNLFVSRMKDINMQEWHNRIEESTRASFIECIRNHLNLVIILISLL